MIWLYVYPLVDNLPSLVRHNAMERQARLDWAGEYDMVIARRLRLASLVTTHSIS